ncbi:hypothetical protein RF11_03029 [Thelohanellus kitauei]|uniref:Uncharacterized protein n=1 Tax=Thelohanellus kitauei TaxID=669202 RepID=A0A0C2ITR3_THEKT|nr:hypothetical protein RF11_03029 [Thelohanellus kitauei]
MASFLNAGSSGASHADLWVSKGLTRETKLQATLGILNTRLISDYLGTPSLIPRRRFDAFVDLELKQLWLKRSLGRQLIPVHTDAEMREVNHEVTGWDRVLDDLIEKERPNRQSQNNYPSKKLQKLYEA